MDAIFKEWLVQKEQVTQTSADANAIQPPVEIDVFVHIILSSAESIANQAKGVEQEQIDILNESYVNADGTPAFVFNLVQVLTWVKSSWWNGNINADNDMKRNTRQGGMSTLNVWFKDIPNDSLGYAYLPSQNVGIRDGVVNHHAAVNGGSYINYNLGDSLVHEVGHWLGLLHSKKTNHQIFPSHRSHPKSHFVTIFAFPFSFQRRL